MIILYVVCSDEGVMFSEFSLSTYGPIKELEGEVLQGPDRDIHVGSAEPSASGAL